VPPLQPSSECQQAVDLPLVNGRDAVGASQFVGQPAVDVLGGRGAPLVSGANPTAPRDAGSNGSRVGDQDLRPVCQHDLSHVAADLLDEHRGVLVN